VDLHLGYRVLLIVLIIASNAFFAAAEASLLSVRKSRLKQMAADGKVGAQAALNLLANPERLLSVVQVGVTLASLALGWVGGDALYPVLVGWWKSFVTPQIEPFLRAAAFILSFLLNTFLHVVIGEVVPKNLAIETADRLAVLVAPPLLVFSRISGPFVTVLEKSSMAVSRALGLKGESAGSGHNIEELRYIVSSSQKHGHLDAFEEEAMQRLLELRDLSAREIMTPRNSIAGAPIESTLDELLMVFHENKYSRIPIYERSAEHVLGIVYSKDLLDVWQQRRRANELRRPSAQFNLRLLLRQPPVVPETKPVSQLIDTFRHSRSHMALVVDEFGSVTGLVTLEDVLEQVFGEIEDEHDVRLPVLPVVWEDIEIDGTTPIRDLVTQYSMQLESNTSYETLAGFILFKLGAIPQPGDSIEQGEFRFTVTVMDRNRIAKVRIEKQAQAADDAIASVQVH